MHFHGRKKTSLVLISGKMKSRPMAGGASNCSTPPLIYVFQALWSDAPAKLANSGQLLVFLPGKAIK